MRDMNGVTLTYSARVFTKSGSEGYIISLHPLTGKVRVRMKKNGLIRKLRADEVTRW